MKTNFISYGACVLKETIIDLPPEYNQRCYSFIQTEAYNYEIYKKNCMEAVIKRKPDFYFTVELFDNLFDIINKEYV